MSFIEVNQVTKEFQVYIRRKGFGNAVKSLFWRPYEVKKAVENISFRMKQGEVVGYIGPNGAGKSTTIKMLAGILYPTSGAIRVNGRIPYENRKENARRIGIVFGQRSQLYWDLPMEETFELYQKIYRIGESQFRRNLDFFVELLDMKEFLRRPVRQLSLGQKMRANLAVALLHDPEIIYLDEPTIGLDVVAKERIRRFIKEVNQEKKTTVILTTHDMTDIEKVCDRIIMIDHGRILHDGPLAGFIEQNSGGHMLTVTFSDPNVQISDPRFKVIKDEGVLKVMLFKKEEISVAEAITVITRNYDITDLNLKEPEIEEIVRGLYDKR